MVEHRADERIRTTEWEDIQYKHGNKVGQYRDREIDIVAQHLADANPNVQLRAYDPVTERYQDKLARNGFDCDTSKKDDEGNAGGEGSDDDEGDDDDDVLGAYRQRRIEELKRAAARNVFGVVRRIAGADYVAEITEASDKCWVVGALTEEGHEGCGMLLQVLQSVAMRHRDVKFVAVPVREALPSFPRAHLPCVVLYKNGALQRQLTGMDPWGPKVPTVEKVERTLATEGVFPRDDESDDDA